MVDATRTARLILDVDILLAAGIESGVPLGIPTLSQAEDAESETPYIWTPQRVHQAAASSISEISGVLGDLIATLQFDEDADVDLPAPGGGGVEVPRGYNRWSHCRRLGHIPAGLTDVSAYTASSDALPASKVPRLRPDRHVGGFIAQSYTRPQVGTLESALGDQTTDTTMVFLAVPPGGIVIEVGDLFRIENEVVMVTAVPAEGATGAAARTYTIARAQESTRFW